MAQVQSHTTVFQPIRPSTPTRRPLNAPRMSPSRMPDPLLTSSTMRNGHFHLDTFSPVNQNGSFEFDRVIKSGKVLRRAKRKGAWKPSWKPAYLVLRPNLLSIYKNAEETELGGSITLSDVTAVARVKKTNTDHVFGIFTPAKNYHFSGITARDTSDWVTLLRIEAKTGEQDELDLPPPSFPGSHREQLDSETTDISAEEETEAPGSPEAPQWPVRGNKSRSSTTQNGQPASRKHSNLREYSGNEQFTTSQSDFSDTATGAQNNAPRPKSLASTSAPKSAQLTPIPDGQPSRPVFQRSTSQLSVTATNMGATPTAPSQPADPNRVIRQGHLQLLKTVSGVRQWKTIWMVLRSSSLGIYKSKQEYSALRVIPLHSLIDAAEIDPISRSKRFCLQVIGEEKTWRFSVEDESELEGWLGALKSVLSKRGREGSSTLPIASSAAAPIPIPGSRHGTTTSETGGSMVYSQVTQAPLSHSPQRDSTINSLAERTAQMATR